MSAQQAFDYLATMLDERYHAFDTVIASLPSWGEAIDNDVQTYVEGVRNVVRANLNWSFRTERYFGKRKDEVKSTCLIEVLRDPMYLREQRKTTTCHGASSKLFISRGSFLDWKWEHLMDLLWCSIYTGVAMFAVLNPWWWPRRAGARCA